MRSLIPAVSVLYALLSVGAVAQDRDSDWEKSQIKHVLLISIDGMHAVDYKNCTEGIAGVNGGKPYCPNLAALGTTGVNYVAANTSKPSDSFPGLMNIVSGATPRLMGVYYDVAYDRSLDGPAVTTGNGNPAAPCMAGKAPTGYTTEYEEGLDIDQTKVNGGAPGASLTDGGIASLDPTKMDRDPAKGCAPVYPWQFVRTNTIYGVIHKAGGYTAWSDKHPAYSSVAGRDGVGVLDDYYSPEINSNVIGLPGVMTPSGISCSSIPDASADLTAWTNSFQNIQCYDTLKVNAILNEIDGKTHSGKHAKTPTIFGMNFQAVSVGQKLIESGPGKGGYLDAAGTPTGNLLSEIEFVDDAIGQMTMRLKDRGLYESTLVIITSKHGQSPIDPNAYDAVPGKTSNGLSPATLISNQLHAAMPPSEDPNASGIGSTEDDVSLLWLTNPSYTDAAVSLLEANRAATGIGQIYYGPSVALNYDTPGWAPNGDPRTPDIIVTPNVGVTYTGSNKKLMEHGGFSHDDTNVMLLVSNPALVPHTVYSEVGTLQVAPSILKALGLDPSKLDGVRLEGTGVLPDLNLNFNER
ncbi:alkaline phosphatase family protein [Telmatobacter sp. DSM 110680]|uniref:Alkaline phosphatase family protein n=1 Tax=Telmatobacter sp. DSM 110680 TaxID=3036704 RepID=A0AAU7DEE8_9BACT